MISIKKLTCNPFQMGKFMVFKTARIEVLWWIGAISLN